MKFIQKNTIYVIIIATSLSFLNAARIIGQDAQISILRTMVHPSDVMKQDPARYMSCFQKYTELINNVAGIYEHNFKACIDSSRRATVAVNEATFGKRHFLENAVKASCSLLRTCSEHDSLEAILQCYANASYNNIQTMYDIHVNATEELAAFREKYFLIKNKEYKCTNDTKRNYEKAYAEKYVSFNDCILGNSDILIENIETTLKGILKPTFKIYTDMQDFTEGMTSEENTSDRNISLENTSENFTAEAVTSEEITSENITSEEITSEEITSEEIPSEEITSAKTPN